VVLLAADDQPGSDRIAERVVSSLHSPRHLRAEEARGILDSVARLNDRAPVAAAILPATTLAYMGQYESSRRVVPSLRFIARLGVAELHILASQRFARLQDLSGQKVNLGPRGSQTEATASLLLGRVPLQVMPLYQDHGSALTALLKGQIAAMMFLAPKPARLFFDVNLSDGVHFLPITEPKGERPLGTVPAQILPEDYSLLSGGEAGRGQPVNTVAVPLVLACYDWAADTSMFLAMARLAEQLSQRGSGLRGFAMAAPVPGWQRFAPVAEWLARGSNETIMTAAENQRKAAFSVVQQHRAASNPNPNLTAEQKEQLFRQFLNWRQGR